MVHLNRKIANSVDFCHWIVGHLYHSMSTKNCQVCYEVYNSDLCIPHKLECGDLICESCIRAEFVDNTFYCPFCYKEFTGDDIFDFAKCLELHEVVDDDNLTSTAEVETFASPDIDDRVFLRRQSVRLQCSESGCKNKAVGTTLRCFQHSQVVNISPFVEIAMNMKENHDLSDISMSGGTFETREKSHTIEPEDLIRRFKQQERLKLGEAMDILNRAKNILSKESNILRIDAPVIAVGDIHGQFYDLLNLLEEGGRPGLENGDSYLFLGDYVDRGSFSCEVIFLLLAYKIAFPDKIFLLRGNHECGSVSGHFGFKEECKIKYGVNGMVIPSHY